MLYADNIYRTVRRIVPTFKLHILTNVLFVYLKGKHGLINLSKTTSNSTHKNRLTKSTWNSPTPMFGTGTKKVTFT